LDQIQQQPILDSFFANGLGQVFQQVDQHIIFRTLACVFGNRDVFLVEIKARNSTEDPNKQKQSHHSNDDKSREKKKQQKKERKEAKKKQMAALP
jgi:hypothetical protein